MREFSQQTVKMESGLEVPLPERLIDLDLYRRLSSYDPHAPEAEHLRPRQSYAAQAFCEQGSAMLRGETPMERMAVIHPTGYGKTMVEAELVRVVSSGEKGHNAVILVPSLQILSQALGTADDIGDIRALNPRATIGRYSGEVKNTRSRITVMNYHMLNTALKNGDWAKIDPKLVIGDEIHHLIDGAWAEDFKRATEGRLTVGFTATPAYSERRDSRDLFPVNLDHVTMREGIRDGVLSDLRGYTYQGANRINLRHGKEELTEEDIFDAVIGSRDNYLAAAICADEVKQGRRGIVSCAPGHDRLHAKVMARILSQTLVDTPEGERPIVAAHVDSTMDVDELEDVFARYNRKKAEIDVITFVSLLLEGWNSPRTDFGVWLRPTPSTVLAEQRMGRLLRRQYGRIATLHEILYVVEGPASAQPVTHLDVLNGKVGHNASVTKLTVGQRNRSGVRPSTVDPTMLSVDHNVAAKVAGQEVSPSDKLTIAAEREDIPSGWDTLHVLATRFGLEHSEAAMVLRDNDVDVLKDDTYDRIRTFYSPEANALLAGHAGIGLEVPESNVTEADVIEFCRYSDMSRIVSIDDLRAYLAKRNIEITKSLVDNKIVISYPESILEGELLDDVPGTKAPRVKRKKYEAQREPQVTVTNWLTRMLVDPRTEETKQGKRNVLIGQSCLVKQLTTGPRPTVVDADRLEADIKRLGIEPTQLMRGIMRAKGVSFVHLLFAAHYAKEDWIKLTTQSHQKQST